MGSCGDGGAAAGGCFLGKRAAMGNLAGAKKVSGGRLEFAKMKTTRSPRMLPRQACRSGEPCRSGEGERGEIGACGEGGREVRVL